MDPLAPGQQGRQLFVNCLPRWWGDTGLVCPYGGTEDMWKYVGQRYMAQQLDEYRSQV